MPATLKVRNEGDKPFEIKFGGDRKPLVIAPKKDKDLSLNELATREFERGLASGSLRLDVQDNKPPTPEKIALARRVLPFMARRASARYTDLYTQLRSATQALEKQRDAYNRLWSFTQDRVKEAQNAAAAVDNLFGGLRRFALHTQPEESRIAQIKDDIQTLEKEDLEQTKRPLKQWYQARQAKEKELGKARAQLEAARHRYVTPFERLLDNLEQAAKTFKVADPKKNIGKKIAEWS